MLENQQFFATFSFLYGFCCCCSWLFYCASIDSFPTGSWPAVRQSVLNWEKDKYVPWSRDNVCQSFPIQDVENMRKPKFCVKFFLIAVILHIFHFFGFFTLETENLRCQFVYTVCSTLTLEFRLLDNQQYATFLLY